MLCVIQNKFCDIAICICKDSCCPLRTLPMETELFVIARATVGMKMCLSDKDCCFAFWFESFFFHISLMWTVCNLLSGSDDNCSNLL